MAALKKYHGDGEETEMVRLEYAEICAAIEHEKTSGRTSWKSMVSTSGNR
jgi:type VI protein secretion system component Hcp